MIVTAKQLLRKFYFLLKKKFKNGLKYCYFNNNSNRLVIVFSGFPSGKPSYNYVRSLKNMKNANKLYILDDFGYKGSYYWYENGNDTPMQLVKGLISNIMGGTKLRM